ncbi:MAG: helix-turn-helix transcriptional regulator [Defluviitaleaceae bacterium]|nr:helix-turn-helix transcriptional regulator [Defluviitaleaceae bacterium]
MNTNHPTPLPMGEKIKQLRIAKGLSQENLAQAIDKSTTFISRLEHDEAEIDTNLLIAIKQYLGVENAPLQKHELELYKSHIWAWNDMVHNRRMEEAKAMRDELSVIQDLPFERELNVLYLMIATRIAVTEWNMTQVEENIISVEDYITEASPDVLYLYHRNMGTLKYYKADFKNCLYHHQQALEYNDNKLRPDVQLMFSIGECFLQIGKPIVALPYLERAKREFIGDRTHQLMYALDITLAGCYMLFGDYEKAKKMYEDLLSMVRSFKVDAMTGNVLVCYGVLPNEP